MKKSSRSWNRREFDIRPAGYFTVTKSAGWFAAWRLPGGFRYLFPQSGEAKAPAAAPASAFTPNEKAIDQGRAILSQSMVPVRDDQGLMQLVLIVLAAAAITFALLWWIAGARP
jgi:hypothetical protein